jgi:hypothetical protein
LRARVLVLVLVVAGCLLIAPGLAKGDGPDRPAPRVTYVVEQGDTLWSITGGSRRDATRVPWWTG